MSARELVILGTASQAPTRMRNHNGYLLRWDDEGILFDPGEGTQRQMQYAGVSSSAITRICISHFHGDHCLGLPGVLQRRSLDRVSHPVDVYFPATGADYFARLKNASIYHETIETRPHPVADDGTALETRSFNLTACRLDHRVDAFGWRLQEPDGRRMLPDRLAELGIAGPDIGKLQRERSLHIGGRTVDIAEVSAERRGQVFAFVMDTRLCDGARKLAENADLLVCEATFLDRDAGLADQYAHLTARQAATLARDAGVRRLVLTHFSQRYPDTEEHRAEAAAVFPDVVVARDLDVVAVPPRRQVPESDRRSSPVESSSRRL